MNSQKNIIGNYGPSFTPIVEEESENSSVKTFLGLFPKVENMKSRSGNFIPNQYVIQTDRGLIFQSYNTIIAFKDVRSKKVYLDADMWDYSVTTGKYRNQFLGEAKKETEQKIKDGDYVLTDLN